MGSNEGEDMTLHKSMISFTNHNPLKNFNEIGHWMSKQITYVVDN
jgi:hypothetical protein